jgi:transcriptional regulator with XRE-family HTH domain
MAHERIIGIMVHENNAIGKYMKAQRKRKNISREELAEMIQTEIELLEKIENGEVAHLAEFVKLCNVLEVSVDQLVEKRKEAISDTEIVSTMSKMNEKEKELLHIVMSRIFETRSKATEAQ